MFNYTLFRTLSLQPVQTALHWFYQAIPVFILSQKYIRSGR